MMPDFFGVKNGPGVYLMLDLDGKPLYAGKSNKVRKRLEQHFIRQESSVTADGLLDIFEVSQVKIWYAEQAYPLLSKIPVLQERPVLPDRTGTLDLLEVAVYKQFKPLWNRARLDCAGPLPDLLLDRADATIELVSSEELPFRRDPVQRIETKLLHMLRALRKARISGASKSVKRSLVHHAKELHGLCQDGLQPAERSTTRTFGHVQGSDSAFKDDEK